MEKQITKNNSNLVSEIRENLTHKLESNGGRPTVKGWKLERAVRFSPETWHALQDLAIETSCDERKITANQIASFLVEKVLSEIED